MFRDEERLRARVARMKAEPPTRDPRLPNEVGGVKWGDWGRPRLQTVANVAQDLQERLYELMEAGVPLATAVDPFAGMEWLEELRRAALELSEAPGRGGRRAPTWHTLAVAAAAEHWNGPEEAFESTCAALLGLTEAQVRTARASELPPDDLERYLANHVTPDAT